MRTRILISVLFLVGLGVQATQAQDIKTIIRNVSKAYANQGGVSMNMSLSYGSLQTGESEEELSGVIKLKGAQKYYKLGSMELVSNKDFTLVVDHQEKIMAVDSVNSGQEFGPPVLEAFSADSILKMMGGGKLEKTTSGDYRITEFPGGVVHHSEVIIDAKTFLIKSVGIYYIGADDKPDEFLRISYSNFKLNSVTTSDFSISKFYAFSGKKITKKAAFSSYEELYNPSN
jgi:hypothetical protein